MMYESLTKNIKWVSISQYGLVLTQFFSLIILSYFIDANAYGAFAIALSIINLSYLFRDLGTTNSIIQNKNMSNEFLDAAHTINIISGFVICIIIILISYPVGYIYKNNDLTNVIIIAGLSLGVSSFGLSNHAVLQKNSEFKKIALIELTGSLVGATVAIVLASMGYGIYSLAAQISGSSALTTFLFIKFRIRHQKISKNWKLNLMIFRHGNSITGFNMIHYLTRNGDVFLIGKIFGPPALGIYVMAMRFCMIPYQIVTLIINRALHPILSVNQDSIGALKNSYINANKIVIKISGALTAFLMIFSDKIVSVSLDPSWADVSETILLLAPSGLIFSIVGICNIYIIASKNQKILVHLGVIQFLLTILSIIVSIKFQFSTFLLLFFLANITFGCLITRRTLQILGITYGQFLNSVKGSFINLTCGAIAMVMSKYIVFSGNLPVFVAIGVAVLSATIYGRSLYTAVKREFIALNKI